MASRAQQKEEARQRRLAQERASAERARRQRRLQMVVGVVVAAVVIAVVAIVLSTKGAKSPSTTSAGAKATATKVNNMLAGIPQSGVVLGSPNAKINVTEFGDLECPVCATFATGAEQTLISNDVRSGKATLTYRSLCTATCNGPNANLFATQQAAALAAGQQNKAWNFIQLFYSEQGQEGTTYVTDSYLSGLASQVPGLNVSKWSSARTSPSLTAQVSSDQQAAAGKGYSSTPTIVIQGPKGTAQPIVGDTNYSALESAIKSVS
jgi:protein-disulfide isomerase